MCFPKQSTGEKVGYIQAYKLLIYLFTFRNFIFKAEASHSAL